MDDCTEDAFCNGRNATCPNPDPKPDNVTECNQGTQVCSTVNFRFKHVRFKKVFRFKEEFHCSQNFST